MLKEIGINSISLNSISLNSISLNSITFDLIPFEITLANIYDKVDFEDRSTQTLGSNL